MNGLGGADTGERGDSEADAGAADGGRGSGAVAGCAGCVPSGPVQFPSQAGVVTQENGRYTLTSNAYEVRLNASVLDASGEVDPDAG